MGKKQFYRSMMVIAMPIALQNLITVGVSMMDTLMLGSLGEAALSASALANQLFFIFTLVIYGTAGGTNVLVAQFWGRKDRESIRRTLAYTYRIVLLFAFIMVALSLFAPRMIMHIFTNDPEVIALGADYLRIVSVSYLFFGIATISGNVLRAVRTVRIGLIASLVSLSVNIVLNWILIFGNLGMPEMGVSGAALATTIARICECITVVVYMKYFEKKIMLKIRDLLHLDRSLRKRFIQNSVPVICNEMLWSLGFSLLTVIIGHMGTAVTAAYSIYNVVSQLSSVMSQGIAAAAAVIVGNTIGAGKQGQLKEVIARLQKAAVGVGLFAFTFVFLSRYSMPFLYDISAESIGYLMDILLIGAFLEGLRPNAFVNMIGILRGGGDAKFVLINDILFLWTICIPLGYLCAFVWNLPVWLTFLVLRFDDVIKLGTSTIRIMQGRWVKDVTREEKTINETEVSI